MRIHILLSSRYPQKRILNSQLVFVRASLRREGEAGKLTWPLTFGLLRNETDVLWTFVGFAREVKRSSEHQVRISTPDFDFGVESLDVDLRCCQNLLSGM